MKKEMSVDEKLACIRKALEMGANVQLNFHNFREKEEAKQAAVELSKMFNLQHKHKSHNGTNWYKIKSDDYTLESSIFYDDDDNFMEEDVQLDGGVEDAS